MRWTLLRTPNRTFLFGFLSFPASLGLKGIVFKYPFQFIFPLNETVLMPHPPLSWSPVNLFTLAEYCKNDQGEGRFEPLSASAWQEGGSEVLVCHVEVYKGRKIKN